MVAKQISGFFGKILPPTCVERSSNSYELTLVVLERIDYELQGIYYMEIEVGTQMR